MIGLKIDIAGEVQYHRALDMMDQELGSMREPLNESMRVLIEAVGEQFRSEGIAGMNGPWVPLSPAYAAWKSQHYPGRPLLVREGTLRASFIDSAAPGSIREISDTRLVYGSEVNYAIYHQQGRGHNPTRKIVDLNLVTRRQIDRIFVDWVRSLKHRMIGL